MSLENLKVGSFIWVKLEVNEIHETKKGHIFQLKNSQQNDVFGNRVDFTVKELDKQAVEFKDRMTIG